jgi:pimeloyl-ACP methyl ester carboxylesterase
MKRRNFLRSALYVSAAAAWPRETAAQGTIDPAAERYRRLQTALLSSRKLDYTERDVDVAPLRLRAHVIEAGRGEPLLLIHGGNGVGAHWLPLMTRLGGWRMIVPDRPGCGLTDGFLYDGVDMRAHGAAFVEGVLDALGVEAASIIGNSMGGYFALCFALAHPDRVRKLVLAGGPAGSARPGSVVPPPREAIEARVRSSRQPGRPGLAGVVADPSRIPDDLLALFDAHLALPGGEESWRSIMRNTHPNRGTFNLHSELEGLRTPTLLIWGKQDRIDPPIPAAIAIADHLPNARLVLLPDAGHAPWMDKPDECATLVTEFLRRS